MIYRFFFHFEILSFTVIYIIIIYTDVGKNLLILQAVAWCPWQPNLLASGGGTADRHIRFWNCSTGTCVQSVDTKSQVSINRWLFKFLKLLYQWKSVVHNVTNLKRIKQIPTWLLSFPLWLWKKLLICQYFHFSVTSKKFDSKIKCVI